MKPIKQHPRLSIIGGIFVFLVIVFLLRGPIRKSWIPAYINHFYKPAVGKKFDEDFSQINPDLAKLGFTFNSRKYYGYECANGDDVSYELWQETVTCMKSQTSDDIQLNSNFIAQWGNNSLAFEKKLLADGWKKQWNQYQPINEIYKPSKDTTSVGVVYSKSHGKITCGLEVVYDRVSTAATSPTYVNENCIRTVRLFGGYY